MESRELEGMTEDEGNESVFGASMAATGINSSDILLSHLNYLAFEDSCLMAPLKIKQVFLN